MPSFSRARVELPESPQKSKLALEAALRVSEIASSAAALPEALQAMVNAAIQLLGAEQGSIMLLDETERNLTLVASYGLPSEVPMGHKLAVGESVAGRVLATGRPLRLGDVDRDAFVNFVPKNRPIASSVVVPMRVLGRPIGVLNLAISSEGALTFTEEDVRVAQMFADQAASVIHRARLHEKAEHRSAELSSLLEASKGLLGRLDVEALLQEVFDGASRLASSKDGFVCIFDPDTGALAGGVFRGVEKDVIKQILEHPDVVSAIDRSSIAAIEIDGADPVAVIGIRTTRGTRGVIVVGGGARTMDERGNLLLAFAQQASSAIGAAELYGEVERKESELSSIILGVPNPIILVDAQARIVAVNTAAEELFSVSGAFTGGAPVVGALGHDEIETMLAGDGEVQGEVMVGSPPRNYKIRVRDVRMPGTPIGRVLIMDDVTTEREIAQRQHDFVAMIGHELRTPLTIIKGFARTLMKRVETASVQQAKEALGTIDAKAAQLERLIEDLLYVSQIESREARLRIEDTNISDLVRSVVDNVLQDHPDREVVLEVAPKLAWPCDETKVSLVVRHLVDNALKYSEGPAPVIVKASDQNDELQIDVVDRGQGLVSSDIPHIFERFRQLDGSATREHGGTGVGLYLCAQLIRVHGGRIWVDSAWGKGSTFSFALPAKSVRTGVVRMQGKRSESVRAAGSKANRG